MADTLKLGTRRSLLALAQSGWVGREIERFNPGLKVELVGIETRGDKILDVSLQNVEGKDFFVAELDSAMKSGEVDLTVHSMKDLSLDRPAEFICAAVPRRENSRDVILFSKNILASLREGKNIRIGTSSPRRLENLPAFLEKALPHLSGHPPKVEFVEIRGNVNTRLGRVFEAEGHPRQLDGVVLAFAGLIRLWADQEARIILSKLLEGIRWMVLPLKECPSAPAQGALAVECRTSDQRVRNALAKLHNPDAARHAEREREILKLWGGGCHQRFGASCIKTPELGEMLFIRGRRENGAFVDEMRWEAPAAPAPGSALRPWDGASSRSSVDQTEPLPPQASLTGHLSGRAVFAAHARAIPESWPAALTGELKQARIWTSGTASWFKLAARGFWVEGCSESMGFSDLEKTLQEKVLQLPSMEQWTVLTHETAMDGWEGGGKVVPTYRIVRSRDSDNSRQSLKEATHIFWTSGSQYDDMGGLTTPSAQHACGPGKTAKHLRAKGVNPTVFPSVQEWRKWLKQ